MHTSQFMHSSHHSLVASISLSCHNQNSPTTQIPRLHKFPDCTNSLTTQIPWPFPVF